MAAFKPLKGSCFMIDSTQYKIILILTSYIIVGGKFKDFLKKHKSFKTNQDKSQIWKKMGYI